MGIVKQKMLDDEYDNDLINFLKQLLEREELNGAIDGIAKQVVTKGVKSMTGNQKPAIDSFVENYKEEHVCERFSNENVGSLTDYIFIAENGLCPACEYDREKYMRE